MKRRYWIIVALYVVCLACITTVYGEVAKFKKITEESYSLKLLKALPYLAFSEEKADESLRGVVLYEKERSYEGFNLLVNGKRKGSTIMDRVKLSDSTCPERNA